MSGTVWTNPKKAEVRVYLRRTNAAKTEAGYISIYEQDGHGYSKYVQTATGTGSRTAEAEAETAFSHYQALRKSSVGAKKEAK